jgi:hypothetical protein
VVQSDKNRALAVRVLFLRCSLHNPRMIQLRYPARGFGLNYIEQSIKRIEMGRETGHG